MNRPGLALGRLIALGDRVVGQNDLAIVYRLDDADHRIRLFAGHLQIFTISEDGRERDRGDAAERRGSLTREHVKCFQVEESLAVQLRCRFEDRPRCYDTGIGISNYARQGFTLVKLPFKMPYEFFTTSSTFSIRL